MGICCKDLCPIFVSSFRVAPLLGPGRLWTLFNQWVGILTIVFIPHDHHTLVYRSEKYFHPLPSRRPIVSHICERLRYCVADLVDSFHIVITMHIVYYIVRYGTTFHKTPTPYAASYGLTGMFTGRSESFPSPGRTKDKMYIKKAIINLLFFDSIVPYVTICEPKPNRRTRDDTLLWSILFAYIVHIRARTIDAPRRHHKNASYVALFTTRV